MVNQTIIKLGGGLSTSESPLAMPPGQVIGSENYECRLDGGYTSIGGFEPQDGRADPAEPTYVVLSATSWDASVVAGVELTGQTSGATGTVAYVSGELVALVDVVGTFVDDEDIEIAEDESGGTIAWNSANEVGSWTFTAADQTAEYVSGPGTNSVVSGTARSSGKRYFEVSWDVASSFGSMVRDDVGLTTSNPPTSGASVTDGAAYRRSGHVFQNNANIATETAIVSADVLGVAVDLDDGNVWFAINGTWVQGDPATGTSPSVAGLPAGSYYAGATIESGGSMKVTLRTLNADFTESKPSGFKSWAAT